MKDKILLVVTGLFGLMFINSGLVKFFGYMEMPELPFEGAKATMGAFIATGWLFPLVAIVEIVGGILIVLPKTRALGAIVILPVMVGIVLFHVVQAPVSLPVTFILLAINIWAIIDNKDKYMGLIG